MCVCRCRARAQADKFKVISRMGLPVEYASKILNPRRKMRKWCAAVRPRQHGESARCATFTDPDAVVRALDGVAGDGPSARKKYLTHVLGGKLFIYGGETEDGEAFDDLYCLDTSSEPRRWSCLYRAENINKLSVEGRQVAAPVLLALALLGLRTHSRPPPLGAGSLLRHEAGLHRLGLTRAARPHQLARPP